MRKILCWLGFHAWTPERQAEYSEHYVFVRNCKHCSTHETILRGYNQMDSHGVEKRERFKR